MKIMWVSWFVIGLLASIIYNKKFKTKEEEKFLTTEGMLFVWGWIGMFVVLIMLGIKHFNKKKS